MRGKQALNIQLALELTDTSAMHPNRIRRNRAIASRFYYYHSIAGLRYEMCLHELCKEFYLAEATLIDILMSESDYLKSLSSNQTSLKDLEAEHPHFRWK